MCCYRTSDQTFFDCLFPCTNNAIKLLGNFDEMKQVNIMHQYVGYFLSHKSKRFFQDRG